MKANPSLKNLIIQKITGLSKEQLFLKPEISEKFQQEIGKALERLEKGEPIEYIVENAEFYGLDFFVDNRVLIPRNDTEVMVDQVLKVCDNPSPSPLPFIRMEGEQNKYTLIDIGTGSGAIPISIIKNSKNIDTCYSVDISEDALEVAKINIRKHGLEKKITILKGSLLEPIIPLLNKEGLGEVFITANLPYIKNGDFENMDQETIEFEPDSALYGGEKTGFELYEELINQCMALKKQKNIKKFFLFIEIGFDQKEVCEKFLKTLDLSFDIFKDNGGVERCIKIEVK